MANNGFRPTRLQQYGPQADPRAYQLPMQGTQTQQTYQQQYNNQNTQYNYQNYNSQNNQSNRQWQEQQYQNPYQPTANSYHSDNSNYAHAPSSDRNYQYDQRYRTNGDGRTVQPQAPKSPLPRSQEVQRPVEKQRPAQIAVDKQQKSRDRMLLQPSSPKTLAWDNPFGSFPPKKKDDDTRSNPDKGSRKTDGSLSPRPLDRPHTSHGHRGDQSSRSAVSQERRPDFPSRPTTAQGNRAELSPRPSTSHSYRADRSPQPPLPKTYRSENPPSPRVQEQAMPIRSPQSTSTRVEIRSQQPPSSAVPARPVLTQRSFTQPESVAGYNDPRAQPQASRDAHITEQQNQFTRDVRHRPSPAPTTMASAERRPSEPAKLPIRSQPTVNEKFDANSYRGIPLTKRRSNQSTDMPNFDAISAPANEKSDNLFPIASKPQSPRPQEQPAYTKQTYQALGPDRKPIRPAATNASSNYYSRDASPASTNPTSPVGDYANPPMNAPARYDYQTNNPVVRPNITTMTASQNAGSEFQKFDYPRAQQAKSPTSSVPQSPIPNYNDRNFRDHMPAKTNKLTSPVPLSPVTANDNYNYNYRGPKSAQTSKLASPVPQSPVPEYDNRSQQFSTSVRTAAQPVASSNNRNAVYANQDQSNSTATQRSAQINLATQDRHQEYEDKGSYDTRTATMQYSSERVMRKQQADYEQQTQYDQRSTQTNGQVTVSRSTTSGSQFPPRTASRPGSRPSPAPQSTNHVRQLSQTSKQDLSRPTTSHDQNRLPQAQNHNQDNGYSQPRQRYDYDQAYSEDQYDPTQYAQTSYTPGDKRNQQDPNQQVYERVQHAQYAQKDFIDYSENEQWSSTSNSNQAIPVRGHENLSKVNATQIPPPRSEYQPAQSAPAQPTYIENSAQLGGPTRVSDPPTREAEVPQFLQDDGQHGAVTIDELNKYREEFKKNPNDYPLGLKFAKRLVEAATVLASENGRADAKQTARNRERYVLDAHKIVKKLVAANFAEAMFYLADCHGQGLLGLAQDPKEAFSLYQSAAKLNHPQSAYRVAVCCELGYEEGGGTRRDPQKAIQWYKRAATLGDTPAMYKMGIILLKGLLGQPRNPREAVSWLKRAAERAEPDNPHALHELALLYESAAPTDHIVRDERYAFQLFTQAAELGYKYSQFRLGSAYEYGLLGCPIDPRSSITWYSRAAAQGEHQSELALSGWYLTGSAPLLQQSDTEAYLWARKAASSGLAKAEYAMGYFTEVGIGTTINHEEAKRWYYRAAAQNYPKAKERLEDLKKGGQKMTKARHSRSNVGKHNEGDCVVM